MKAQLVFTLVAAGVLAGCATVNSDTVKDMPSGYLCRLLDSSEYITTPGEQMAIYSELESRNQQCVDTNVQVIVK